MKKKNNTKKFIITLAAYFGVFYLIPLILSSIDFFTKDFGYYLWYMLYIFAPLSVVFFIASLNILGFSKKRLFGLIGFLILTYLISAIYIYIRFYIALSNPRFMTF